MKETSRFQALVIQFEGERQPDGRTPSGQLLIDLKLIETARDPDALIATEIAAHLAQAKEAGF